MVLYLSSAIDRNTYSYYFSKGLVGVSIQAQRFNSLVIEGIGLHCPVCAVGHPAYKSTTDSIDNVEKIVGNVRYYIIGKQHGRQNKLSNFRQLWKICKSIIKIEKVEVVVCDAISPLYSLAARLLSLKFGIPTIAIVTDVPVIMDASNPTLMTKISQFLVKKHDGYVLLTEAMNVLVNPQGKPYIIMEGLCEQTENSNTDRQLNSDKEIILYTGSLSVQTGIENLIEAFKRIKREDVELWIYGGGKAEVYVKKAVIENRQIYFGGLVNNEAAADLQREADILVNPRPTTLGYVEYSFPSKIMEYMASGTPVISTKLPGIPTEYFDYIYTFKDDSVLGISETLERVLNIDRNQRKLMGKRAKDFVCDNKNQKIQGGRIIELTKQISSKK